MILMKVMRKAMMETGEGGGGKGYVENGGYSPT